MEWTAQRQSETKVEDRGEPEEAAAEIESGGRRKEIAENIEALTEKSGLFLHFYYIYAISSFSFFVHFYLVRNLNTSND